MDIKSRDIFKRLDWVIMDELELSLCESNRVREYTTLSKISSKTLNKLMMGLSSAVEAKIATGNILYTGLTALSSSTITIYCIVNLAMNNTITMFWLNRQLYVLIFIILN